jgi:hypothetical protein
MKNLRAVLDAADPLRDEPALAIPDVREMRRRILGAAETSSFLSVPRALPVAALVVMMVVAGVAAGRRLTAPPVPAVGDVVDFLPAGGERRQVQFATPGGTRIIWTIDPNFQLRGTLP